jgi:hypothetical protein
MGFMRFIGFMGFIGFMRFIGFMGFMGFIGFMKFRRLFRALSVRIYTSRCQVFSMANTVKYVYETLKVS